MGQTAPDHYLLEANRNIRELIEDTRIPSSVRAELADEFDEIEIEVLENAGFEVPGKAGMYSINENLLGVTMSGSEIDRFEPLQAGDRPAGDQLSARAVLA